MATPQTDRESIVATLVRLMHSLDRGDVEAFGDCWTEDVDFEVTFVDGRVVTARGRAAMKAMIAPASAGRGRLRHVLGGVEIALLGEDRASAFHYCTYHTVGAQGGYAGLGEYHNELRREADDTWRVSRRRHLFLTELELGHG